jgi:mannose-6-phosphate isomerase-like protein (cupin superfamily)
MSERKAIHPMDPAVAGMSLQEISKKYIARFGERKPDDNFIPARGFTLSIMYVPSGQGNAAHTHEAEEVFFVLKGHLMVFFEDVAGNRVESVLGPWDCVSCPAGVIHGYHNNTLEPVYTQVMLGKGQATDFMGYADPELYARRDEHVRKANAG